MSEIPIGLDNLATSGIIDFDADAYIKGTKPRYVGRPQAQNYQFLEQQPLPAYPIHQAPPLVAHSQPVKDEFVNHDKQTWKKALLGALVAGVTILGVTKYKAKIENKAKDSKSFFQKLLKVPTWAKVTGGGMLALLGLTGLYKAAAASHKNRKHS